MNILIMLFFADQIPLGMLAAACLFVPWKQRRPFFLPRILGGTALFLGVCTALSTLQLPLTGSLLLYTGLALLLIWGCFDCDLIHAVFSTTCAYAVQHATSKVAYMAVVGTGAVWEWWQIVLLLLAVNLAAFAPIYLQFTRRCTKNGRLMFDSVRTVMLSGAFLVVAVFLSSLLEDNLDRMAETYTTSYLALNAFCALFAVVILSMEFTNCSVKRLESEKLTLESLLENDKLQYEQAKKNMEQINIRYHDLKQQYSHAVDDEERAKLEAEMQALNLRYYTGNKAVDIALTQKAILCEKAGVRFVCSVDGGCLDGVKHYHIYSLLGNAIDNAVECLSKVDDGEKKVIDLDISRRGDMAVIRIENYTPTLPVSRDGALVTTKKDPAGHGYGVKSIKNIADIYGGTAEYFVEDEVFCLLVTLPCGQDKTA